MNQRKELIDQIIKTTKKMLPKDELLFDEYDTKLAIGYFLHKLNR